MGIPPALAEYLPTEDEIYEFHERMGLSDGMGTEQEREAFAINELISSRLAKLENE